ncbi:MFS transporter [Mucilaginibacter ginkgonis]|uniref:MFS transporter n=1 Tax=Mucilaginibacter ginkgonis TaxID=2682091 RepID=A0A6I4INN2_9SPHI|nr:MFS transporter [Mucilaginibacter ginkgonis]QQL48576.1 MFS transporter [Mucilaginibacter ginkgonis]
MKTLSETAPSAGAQQQISTTTFSILFALSASHMFNDTFQSLIPAIYPLIKGAFHLTFFQIGMITLVNQITASILQPFVGNYTDKKPQPYSLMLGMLFTLIGLISIAFASSFGLILVSVALVGIGSSIFHPEASRIARAASGGKAGTAQSIFQLGGNAGSSLGPLIAAILITPYGRHSIAWVAILAFIALFIMYRVGAWYTNRLKENARVAKTSTGAIDSQVTKKQVYIALTVLIILTFSKYFYLASMSSYFTFYLIDKFHVSAQTSQYFLFLFLVSVAAGTIIGGPVGDKIGRKYVIWVSILGVAPFTLLLPYVNLFWTGALVVIIGIVLSSAFSAIVVYAQELMPGKVGMVAGLFFGLAFGMGGIGSAVLGDLADKIGIQEVYKLCAFLPLIGILTIFLPNLKTTR